MRNDTSSLEQTECAIQIICSFNSIFTRQVIYLQSLQKDGFHYNDVLTEDRSSSASAKIVALHFSHRKHSIVSFPPAENRTCGHHRKHNCPLHLVLFIWALMSLMPHPSACPFKPTPIPVNAVWKINASRFLTYCVCSAKKKRAVNNKSRRKHMNREMFEVNIRYYGGDLEPNFLLWTCFPNKLHSKLSYSSFSQVLVHQTAS